MLHYSEKQNQFNHPSPSISPVDHSNFNYQSENFYREYLEYSFDIASVGDWNQESALFT